MSDRAKSASEGMKRIIRGMPILGGLVVRLYRSVRSRHAPPPPFSGSATYWEQRYLNGGNSGVGSYGKFARFKADVINQFVAQHGVKSVIEFGCGDGNQLELAKYPGYRGFDVSETAISLCRKRFAADHTKQFRLMSEYTGETADLALSLDVIFHLVEDDVFQAHIATLFNAADRYVIIYSSNADDNHGYEGTHVRHRKFTDWIATNVGLWKMMEQVTNQYPYRGDYREGSFADLYVYENTGGPGWRERVPGRAP